jgi:aspartyl-tRNA(Asn)/glutamyl-tRNA(Gln) amidotransferase subunit A
MTEIHELGVAESAKQIREGALSAVKLAEVLLTRIEAHRELKAWVYLDRDAVLAAAQTCDAAQRKGEGKGALHGVPVGLKDIYCTAGIPTTACSKVYANHVPDEDATTVVRLKAAGAIILGKTVTTEFACSDPSPTINPWNAAHTPGGSSSGSAVAVAARHCAVAFGSQTRGSVLRPAAYNGVVGLKPTFGRVSRRGVIPVSWSLDHVGWMTRSVEDAALMLQVMAGADGGDPVCVTDPVPDYLTELDQGSPPRIGLLKDFFFDNADVETREHIESVSEVLASAGAELVTLSLPGSFAASMEDQIVIMAVEAATFHEPMYRQRANDYGPMLRDLIERGLATDGLTYSRALERRLAFTADARRLAAAVDVLMTPSTPTPALADVTNTGDTLFQGPWTACGLPTITLPTGLAASGLPLGIQLAADSFDESGLLQHAHWCERQLNNRLLPPGI